MQVVTSLLHLRTRFAEPIVMSQPYVFLPLSLSRSIIHTKLNVFRCHASLPNLVLVFFAAGLPERINVLPSRGLHIYTPAF